MARLPRIVISNQPLHIMHRGNNHQNIFKTDEDMLRIKADIKNSLAQYKCYLHAYVFMSNHLHLLITPKNKKELIGFMQSMANRYVRYFNVKYKRTGTIWEGRYKSCLVDSDNYLFALYKYIEMNPVKANMTTKVVDYPWSSYHYNAVGNDDELITPHMLYTELGKDMKTRSSSYRQIFSHENTKQQEKDISMATTRGEVYGSHEFHNKISNIVSRVTKLSKHGGDRKSVGYCENQAG